MASASRARRRYGLRRCGALNSSATRCPGACRCGACASRVVHPVKRYAILAAVGVVVLVAILFSLRQQRSPFLQVEAIAAADSLEAALTALDRESSLRVEADSVAAEAVRELAQARESARPGRGSPRENPCVRHEHAVDELLERVEPELAQEIQEAITQERTAQVAASEALRVQLSLADSMTAVVVQENFALRSENAAQRRAISAYERSRVIDRAIIQELAPGWYDHWIIRSVTHATAFFLGTQGGGGG